QIQIVRAIARIHLIEIRNSISMIGILGHVIFLYRIEPQRCDAKVLDVIQFGKDSCQVATMSSTREGPVNVSLLHTFDDIVTRIAVHKTVWSDEIYHIPSG